jgi:molecular chaperone DnaK
MTAMAGVTGDGRRGDEVDGVDAPYRLSVDVGTTYTAAALERGGRIESVSLGDGLSSVVPTVVYHADGQVLVGPAAARRAVAEAANVVREFKRRVGDPTPVLVGGMPVAAEQLMAWVVSWVVGQVAAAEGGPPSGVVATHPATWGAHRLDRFRAALRGAGVPVDQLAPEPVAAAAFYASQRRVPAGSLVAVYDLGGGTFDATVVEAGDPTFTIRGQPDGIERLGGVDFDHALFDHVTTAAAVDVARLDPDDAGTVAAIAQLRRSCTDAKEALSDASAVTVPVLLPSRHTEVRLTRPDLEALIRPAVAETVGSLRRAVDSAGVAVEDLTAVLLVGGSSRIPLIRQVVTHELGRPVAVDARPKDAVAMGAAHLPATRPPATSPGGSSDASPPSSGRSPDGPPAAPPSSGWSQDEPPTGPPSHRRRRRAALAGAVAAIVVTVAAVAVATRDDDEAPPSEQAGPTSSGETPGPGPGPGRGGADPGPAVSEPLADTFDLSGLTVRLGWLDTTDQFLLANVTAEALEAAGATVVADGPAPALGAEGLRDQLAAGELDVFWDYLGRPAGIDDVDLPVMGTPGQVRELLAELDEPNGLAWLEPAAYTLEGGLAMGRADAEDLGVTAIADLVQLAEDDPDAVSACFVIEDSLEGLEATYGFTARHVFVPLPDDVYRSIGNGQCTVGEVANAIHPDVVADDLVVLDDNRGYYTPMNPAPRTRTDFAAATPELGDLLALVAAELDDATMADLVARVEDDGELAADVAVDWLRARGFVV